MLDLTGTGESFRLARDPTVTAEFALSMVHRYAGHANLYLPLLSPLRGSLDGLPPLLIQVGGDEGLLGDAVRLRHEAQTAGVEVSLRIWPSMWHGWHVFAPYLPEARQAVADIAAFVREHLALARVGRQ